MLHTCYHLFKLQTSDLFPIEALVFKGMPFALIIGIDDYRSKDIGSLHGAVPDARAVKSYLMDDLKTPEDHIVVLENESASRAVILQELRRLATDPRIQPLDSIVIYFAGHGSRVVAPAGWEAGGPNGYIQLILPYDAYCESGGNVIGPIPDRTLGGLIDDIAREKGNNIVVIMDSCYSASGTRSMDSSPELVRSTPLPSNFHLQQSLYQERWPSSTGLGSHVLLAACSSSGLAYESDRRGVFTVALLDLLSRSSISELRYCDVVMRLDIDARQSPQCEGSNQDKLVFTLTSPASPSEIFIPHRTRVGTTDSMKYVINGGAAHGLVVGEELDVYPDMDSNESEGTLVVAETFSYSSIMRPQKPGVHVPLGGNAVAKRVKQRLQSPRVYGCPADEVIKMPSCLQDSSIITFVNAPKDAQIEISMQQDNRISLRLANIMTFDPGLGTESTVNVEEFTHSLQAALRVSSELDHTAYDPVLTELIEIEMYELKNSSYHFPDAPATELDPLAIIPSSRESFNVDQDIPYGIKIINKSRYDLYPTVQLLNANHGFEIVTLYRPGCSQSGLDVPLRAGRSLAIGYGSSGSAPVFFPSADGQHVSFLKVSLYTRPLDPFYNAQSFRKIKVLPKEFTNPWTTITKAIICHPATTRRDSSLSQEHKGEYQIYRPTHPPLKPNISRTMIHYTQAKGVFFDPEPVLENLPGLFEVCQRWCNQIYARIFGFWISHAALA